MQVDLAHAQAAKPRLAQRLAAIPSFNGIGVGRHGSGYGLVVFLADERDRGRIDEEFEGVPVSVEITGRVSAIGDR